MIDPLEAAIKFLLARPSLIALVSTRIAARHRYGVSWAADANSLVVKLDDDLPIYDYPVRESRLELRIRANDLDKAMDIWLGLLEISRSAERVVVVTSKGNALVYSFLPDSSISTPLDVELQMPMVMGFWRIRVAENAV